ncbi:MAG: hypothetical protein ACLGG4_09010, partial [Gammaproteobacteria bacterium]
MVGPAEKEVVLSGRVPPVLRPEHPSARPLGGLVEAFGLEAAHGRVDGVEVTGITLATGDLRPGDLYVGVRGQ